MRVLAVADRVVQVATMPDPSPGEGEVVVAVDSCGICGSDVHAVEVGRATNGQVLGHEISGTVVALGRGVDAVRIDDAVAVNPLGSCGRCEECARGLSLALHGARLAGAGAGTRAVVFGTGPVGLSVVLALRALGAGEIVAIGRSPGRRRAAEAVGADVVVDSSAVDLDGYFDELAGRFDAAFECSGAETAFDLLVRALGSGGKLVELALTAHVARVPLGSSW